MSVSKFNSNISENDIKNGWQADAVPTNRDDEFTDVVFQKEGDWDNGTQVKTEEEAPTTDVIHDYPTILYGESKKTIKSNKGLVILAIAAIALWIAK